MGKLSVLVFLVGIPFVIGCSDGDGVKDSKETGKFTCESACKKIAGCFNPDTEIPQEFLDNCIKNCDEGSMGPNAAKLGDETKQELLSCYKGMDCAEIKGEKPADCLVELGKKIAGVNTPPPSEQTPPAEEQKTIVNETETETKEEGDTNAPPATPPTPRFSLPAGVGTLAPGAVPVPPSGAQVLPAGVPIPPAGTIPQPGGVQRLPVRLPGVP
ncbi:MAG: hypothetical protein HYS22_08165 [Deltaproteobacteria bacterium]|nr:hypothetical protein [Deltaproteobacteria bacterium]